MADETKTKEQLIAEIEALKKEVEQSTSGTGKPAPTADAAPVGSAPRTRRGVLSWITPVILSLGTVAKVGTARAASTDDFVAPAPTAAPTAAPTRAGRCIPAAPAAAPAASPAVDPTAKQ